MFVSQTQLLAIYFHSTVAMNIAKWHFRACLVKHDGKVEN